MKFEQQMQEITSHEGLLRCFDEETKLLEGIKRFITQRIKCDRDYVASLAVIVNTALKAETPSFQSQIYTVSIL